MWPELKISFFKCKKKFVAPIVILLGLLISIWSSCIFIVCVSQYGWISDLKKIVAATGILCFITIGVAVTAGLIWAFEKRDPAFILPWMYTKLIEITFMLIGIILLATHGLYVWLILPAVICILIGGYITNGVWETYKKEFVERQTQVVRTYPVYKKNPWIFDSDYWYHIPAPYMPCSDNMKTGSIIILGLLVSFWASCVLNAGITRRIYFSYLDHVIEGFGIATYTIISIAAALSLIYGLIQGDPDFVLLWFHNKSGDFTAALVGTIFVSVDGNWGLSIVGVLIIAIGLYTIDCVAKALKIMREKMPTKTQCDPGLDQPPAYADVTNQTLHV